MIVVHGGAGPVAPERADRLRAGVRAAAAAGNNLLQRGGSALDAVVAAVRVLEDDPEFGAGIGSALTRDNTIETCASVMDGATRRVGAVAAVPDLATPVIVARAVLEIGEHALITGAGAARFAQEIGIQPAAPGALVTPRAQQQLAAAKGKPFSQGGGVGAVARDRNGNLAAATSTGGAVFRRAGDVDDAAVPGVGTWADDQFAISTSGGEVIFRVTLAHDIAKRAQHGGARAAMKAALTELHKLAPDAIAGAIAVGKDSWAILQLGPAMPVAWIDDLGPNDSLGFPL